MNPFGGNAFGNGVSPAPIFSGPLPNQGFGQFGNAGGFFNGGAGVPQFQGGNIFPAGGVVFPPRSFSPGPMNGPVIPPRSYSPGPMNGPVIGGFGNPLIPGSGFGNPIAPGNGFVNPPMPFPGGPIQPPFIGPNQFGSGAFERPRSRHSSRHRSKPRRRHSRSSSSSDEEPYGRGVPYGGRGSPFAGPGIPYQNLQPFPNMAPPSPRAGSPVIPPRAPVW